MMPLPRLMVAPNGARRTHADHPALPMTLPEITATARACFAAGADGLHLHIRDKAGQHSIDPGRYREALQDLTQAVPDMAVQITTEAVGVFSPQTQRETALSVGAKLVSVSVREMTSDGNKPAARRFYDTAAAQNIAVQHILYDISDLDLLQDTIDPDLFTSPNLQVLYVLGRYTQGQTSDPTMLTPFLTAAQKKGIQPDWGVCAFGRGETECLVAAHRAGGKLRVGFENALWHSDGTLARDNADRVNAVQRACAAADAG